MMGTVVQPWAGQSDQARHQRQHAATVTANECEQRVFERHAADTKGLEK